MPKQSLGVSCPVFPASGNIPQKYTCDGENINPPISVKNIPTDAQSLALIMEDPDAPGGTYLHWVCWNIPPRINIAEDSNPGIAGRNDMGDNGYYGPCPPSGTHHYHFRVFALDNMPDLQEGSTREDLEEVMEGHILAKGEFMGVYTRDR